MANGLPMRHMGTAPRILIAEDDTDVREFVDVVLRDAGYLTARVVDGQEALELVERFGPFDLLLTDVVMPRLDGADLARQLLKRDPSLKVLYFTAYRDRLLTKTPVLSAAEACVDKPATRDQLLMAIARLLNEPRDPHTAGAV